MKGTHHRFQPGKALPGTRLVAATSREDPEGVPAARKSDGFVESFSRKAIGREAFQGAASRPPSNASLHSSEVLAGKQARLIDAQARPSPGSFFHLRPSFPARTLLAGEESRQEEESSAASSGSLSGCSTVASVPSRPPTGLRDSCEAAHREDQESPKARRKQSGRGQHLKSEMEERSAIKREERRNSERKVIYDASSRRPLSAGVSIQHAPERRRQSGDTCTVPKGEKDDNFVNIAAFPSPWVDEDNHAKHRNRPVLDSSAKRDREGRGPPSAPDGLSLPPSVWAIEAASDAYRKELRIRAHAARQRVKKEDASALLVHNPPSHAPSADLYGSLQEDQVYECPFGAFAHAEKLQDGASEIEEEPSEQVDKAEEATAGGRHYLAVQRSTGVTPDPSVHKEEEPVPEELPRTLIIRSSPRPEGAKFPRAEEASGLETKPNKPREDHSAKSREGAKPRPRYASLFPASHLCNRPRQQRQPAVRETSPSPRGTSKEPLFSKRHQAFLKPLIDPRDCWPSTRPLHVSDQTCNARPLFREPRSPFASPFLPVVGQDGSTKIVHTAPEQRAARRGANVSGVTLHGFRPAPREGGLLAVSGCFSPPPRSAASEFPSRRVDQWNEKSAAWAPDSPLGSVGVRRSLPFPGAAGMPSPTPRTRGSDSPSPALSPALSSAARLLEVDRQMKREERSTSPSLATAVFGGMAIKSRRMDAEPPEWNDEERGRRQRLQKLRLEEEVEELRAKQARVSKDAHEATQLKTQVQEERTRAQNLTLLYHAEQKKASELHDRVQAMVQELQATRSELKTAQRALEEATKARQSEKRAANLRCEHEKVESHKGVEKVRTCELPRRSASPDRVFADRRIVENALKYTKRDPSPSSTCDSEESSRWVVHENMAARRVSTASSHCGRGSRHPRPSLDTESDNGFPQETRQTCKAKVVEFNDNLPTTTFAHRPSSASLLGLKFSGSPPPSPTHISSHRMSVAPPPPSISKSRLLLPRTAYSPVEVSPAHLGARQREPGEGRLSQKEGAGLDSSFHSCAGPQTERVSPPPAVLSPDAPRLSEEAHRRENLSPRSLYFAMTSGDTSVPVWSGPSVDSPRSRPPLEEPRELCRVRRASEMTIHAPRGDTRDFRSFEADSVEARLKRELAEADRRSFGLSSQQFEELLQTLTGVGELLKPLAYAATHKGSTGAPVLDVPAVLEKLRASAHLHPELSRLYRDLARLCTSSPPESREQEPMSWGLSARRETPRGDEREQEDAAFREPVGEADRVPAAERRHRKAKKWDIGGEDILWMKREEETDLARELRKSYEELWLQPHMKPDIIADRAEREKRERRRQRRMQERAKKRHGLHIGVSFSEPEKTARGLQDDDNCPDLLADLPAQHKSRKTWKTAPVISESEVLLFGATPVVLPTEKRRKKRHASSDDSDSDASTMSADSRDYRSASKHSRPSCPSGVSSRLSSGKDRYGLPGSTSPAALGASASRFGAPAKKGPFSFTDPDRFQRVLRALSQEKRRQTAPASGSQSRWHSLGETPTPWAPARGAPTARPLALPKQTLLRDVEEFTDFTSSDSSSLLARRRRRRARDAKECERRSRGTRDESDDVRGRGHGKEHLREREREAEKRHSVRRDLGSKREEERRREKDASSERRRVSVDRDATHRRRGSADDDSLERTKRRREREKKEKRASSSSKGLGDVSESHRRRSEGASEKKKTDGAAKTAQNAQPVSGLKKTSAASSEVPTVPVGKGVLDYSPQSAQAKAEAPKKNDSLQLPKKEDASAAAKPGGPSEDGKKSESAPSCLKAKNEGEKKEKEDTKASPSGKEAVSAKQGGGSLSEKAAETEAKKEEAKMPSKKAEADGKAAPVKKEEGKQEGSKAPTKASDPKQNPEAAGAQTAKMGLSGAPKPAPTIHIACLQELVPLDGKKQADRKFVVVIHNEGEQALELMKAKKGIITEEHATRLEPNPNSLQLANIEEQLTLDKVDLGKPIVVTAVELAAEGPKIFAASKPVIIDKLRDESMLQLDTVDKESKKCVKAGAMRFTLGSEQNGGPKASEKAVATKKENGKSSGEAKNSSTQKAPETNEKKVPSPASKAGAQTKKGDPLPADKKEGTGVSETKKADGVKTVAEGKKAGQPKKAGPPAAKGKDGPKQASGAAKTTKPPQAKPAAGTVKKASPSAPQRKKLTPRQPPPPVAKVSAAPKT
ncbi:hypothetical protein TGRH88_042670 [Toxoplasma gondii]|uniref:Uncharacterized protein n=1 Tax=Toxoplasma gondii TaxID=5811 RepID=A0A7J6K1T3_TOXGO|nr:hypothetical protein TGRH88_042670 [Toxoplasma gondii]